MLWGLHFSYSTALRVTTLHSSPRELGQDDSAPSLGQPSNFGWSLADPEGWSCPRSLYPSQVPAGHSQQWLSAHLSTSNWTTLHVHGQKSTRISTNQHQQMQEQQLPHSPPLFLRNYLMRLLLGIQWLIFTRLLLIFCQRHLWGKMNVAATDWIKTTTHNNPSDKLRAVFCYHHKPASDKQHTGELQAPKQTY